MSTVKLRGSEYLLGADEPERSRLLLQAEIHRIVEAGVLTADRLDEQQAQLARHLARADTFVIHPLLFQAWARR